MIRLAVPSLRLLAGALAPARSLPHVRSLASSTAQSASHSAGPTNPNVQPPSTSGPALTSGPSVTTGPFPASRNAPAPASTPPPRSSSGGFIRGSVIGFLLGLTLCGGVAYVRLLEDHGRASQQVLASLEDLQRAAGKAGQLTRRLDAIERDVKVLSGRGVTKQELEETRNELLKAVDDVNVSHLELKTTVWDLSQQIKSK